MDETTPATVRGALPDGADGPGPHVLGPLMAHLSAAGFARAEAPLLVPAEPFIALSGEDIRGRLFLTQDAAGRALCLRPEFTIPLALDLIARADLPPRADLALAGPVFRQRPGASGEFPMVGLESFGREDREAADAEVIALALEACERLAGEAGGPGARRLVLGDVGLLDAVLGALCVPEGEARRLRRALAAGHPLPATTAAGGSAPALEAALPEAAAYPEALEALRAAPPAQALAFLTDLLAAGSAGAAPGGRSAAEIAERFLARAGEAPLPDERRAVLTRFLALAGDPDELAEGARALAGDAGLDLAAALDAYETRAGFLAARGVDLAAVDARAGFVRDLDYYSGVVFEVRGPGPRPLAGGGRYDRLCERLGAPGPVPAVGAAIWVERFGVSEDDS